jgi:membrane protease YdiL (CAAX protease family)
VTELARAALPFLLAAGFVVYFDSASRARGLDPPGFRNPLRRVLGLTVLALGLAITAFGPLASIGAEAPTATDFAGVPSWQLFVVHALLIATLITWFSAAFGGRGGGLAAQVGLKAKRPVSELGVGVLFGIASWLTVLAAAWAVAMLVAALGGEELIPKRPPAAVVWLVGQSIALRIGLALSAGVVEEVFFRGFLQPRIGILGSTAVFALAHLSYGQPFLLVGITLLSLFYGLLVRWRQSVWAAIAAHAVFDLVQLLIVAPSLLRQFSGFFPE